MQMTVSHPTNVDDDMIGQPGEQHYAQPLQVRTGVTFLLQRINIATTFREVIDSVWNIGGDIDNLPYDLVLDCDKKISNALSEFDKKFDISRSDSLGDRQNNGIPGLNVTSSHSNHLFIIQRTMGFFGTHARLSRLHRPYLVRGARDPQYAYSRMVCLVCIQPSPVS
jgi:hypothetical protein